LTVPSNFTGAPGSNALDQMQLVVNILIQLFGELVVSDGIVVYLSAKWAKSYPVDISLYWHRRDRVVYGAALVLIAFYLLSVLKAFTGFMCFTATLDDGVVVVGWGSMGTTLCRFARFR